jgi:hypothetical protein
VRKGSLARALPAAGARAAALTRAVVAPRAGFVVGERPGSHHVAGPLTLGAHEPADLAKPKRIARFITDTTGEPAQDLTLLSGDKNAVLVTEPFDGFLALSARYAHPEAQQVRRVHWVESVSACSGAPCTTQRLTHTPFGPVDALVLSETPFGYQLLTQIDGFPDPELVTIRFAIENFDTSVWAIRDFDGVVAIARRAQAGLSASGTSRQRPAPVSTRAVRPGRNRSSGRAWSSLSALTPRSS